MKKLRMDLDALGVQSFETGGGVLGYDSTEYTPCGACDQPNTGDTYCAEDGTLYGCKTDGPCSNYTCDPGCYYTRTCADRFTCGQCPTYTEPPMESCVFTCISRPTFCNC